MIINTNMGSSTAARILANNTSELQKSLRRLSTGSKIASISDNAAGIAVATKFGAEINRIAASKDNVSNMISFAQTQESYLDQVSSALKRMSELAMLATDETKTSTDKGLYQKEFAELDSFITSVGTKKFNDISLFTGTGMTITVGLSEQVALNGATFYATSATIGSSAAALAALSTVNSKLASLATTQAEIGSNLSRLESESAALSTLKDNLASARSRIVDVDVAEESANFAKQQILVQSGTAMLAQANILPQAALRLIN